jgi:hypothetical protein
VGLSERFAAQAEACAALGSPLYADLLRGLVPDLEDPGSALRLVLHGHEDAPTDAALALRVLGSVHRLVLERRAGPLAAFYPSVGGTWDPAGGVAAFREVLAEQPAEVASWLDRAPQTNEVGRSSALWAALCVNAAEEQAAGGTLPVRLLELGSSAGLNLNADRFAHVGADGEVRGEPASVVRLQPAWVGAAPPDVAPRVVERLGCDLHPVDVSTTEGRLSLTAYVWPDQVARFERLRAALAIAAEHPPAVVTSSAADFVDGVETAEGTTTVLWHSVMWQYLDAAEQEHVLARLEELGATATHTRRLVHVGAEPGRRSPDAEIEFLLRVRAWPGGQERVLGTLQAHGPPLRLEV